MAHGCGCLYLLLILNLFEATIAASQIKLSENGSVEPDETYDGTDVHTLYTECYKYDETI